MKILKMFYFGMLLFLCNMQAITGQTRYYTQLKIVSGDRSERKGDGSGQFITFNEKGCYDSDKDGYTVNNGFLKFGQRNGDKVYYSGSSYWGDATYVFTDNYRRLNVRVTSSDKIYVYTLSSPPAGTLTCALIKGKDTPAVVPVIINPYPVVITTPSTTTPSTTTTTKTCSFCRGTGISPTKKYAPHYGGATTYVRCSQCGAMDKPHYHESCPSCRGRGYTGGY